MSRKTYKLFPSDLPPPGCEDYVGSNEANNVHFTKQYFYFPSKGTLTITP